MKEFQCKCCGDCCSGDMEIFLNLYDLYKIAKHRGYTSTKTLFDNRIVSIAKGQNSMLFPRMVFKKYPYKFCPFLINDVDEKMNIRGFCSLHPYTKPLVCILAPHSKIYDNDSKESKYIYTKPTESCPGKLADFENSNKQILDPILLELAYDNDFFNILSLIKDKNIQNYESKLYYFSTKRAFKDTMLQLRSYYEKA
ncbi:hypothetical protein EW093_14430 [Thiospirochaeta perfilievii]|uniref:YkgJ family cysteine cluster protein n=1 Tax=Thiospirochaeta perfilievii TaxID=252967 RepID=A0A5C1QGZ6_9SPIO|nr:YkgJ family cysteine cluster protein [Thiospirochaeta perfilievii]QEN05846.1 hypothetical protein EW093_14430 [Thiospirochaeta perfilievii]